MFYYTKEGEVVSFAGGTELTKGTQGSILRLNEDPSVCLKKYFDEKNKSSIFDDPGKRFDQDMFDYFKYEFNHDSFCKLYELLYDEKIAKVLAYTMKYYEECIENILFLPTSYLLDNYSLIYDAIERLTKDCIRIVDLSSSNIINTSNGMIVIDYDKYYRDVDSEYDTLSYINKSALLYAFEGIFKNALKKHGIDINKHTEFKKLISSLFTINTSPLVLKCKLRGYNRPIDYFVR